VQRLVAFHVDDAWRHQALVTDRIGFRRIPGIFEGLRRARPGLVIQATQD
jgi:hypothetical protein